MKTDILRGERLKEAEKRALELTSSIESDLEILEEVITINKAHIIMLWKNNLISKEEVKAILIALRKAKDMNLDKSLEDIHICLENFVIESIGKDLGSNINLAKSRNDQVATALRMRLRLYLLDILSSTINLCSALLVRVKENLDTLLPGYTHLQRAQPISLSSHLLSYVFSLIRDAKRLISCYERANECPMGSGALATTTLPIDRKFLSSLLGFDKPLENSIDGVSSRDFLIEALSDLSLIMTHLSSLSEELILWSSKEFNFVEIDDKYSSTSSIMPQKKNPIVAEFIRAKAGSCIAHLIAALTIVKALPRSYNLDLQEINQHLWSACKDTLNSIEMMEAMILSLKFNKDSMLEAIKDPMLLATDLADHLTLTYKIPFRRAHNLVGALVRVSLESKEDLRDSLKKNIAPISQRLLGKEIKLREEEIDKIFNFKEAVNRRNTLGGVSSKACIEAISKAKRSLEKLNLLILKKRESIEKSFKLLKDYEVEAIG
ncbi:MAG: argininosuccinate lyase [Nitrososphaerales archaeon]